MRKIPVPLAEPNLEELKKLVHQYIAFRAGPEWYEDNDRMDYIAEAAVEAFYGKQIWPWINKGER
jgi:hypothetical protein